ncbi:heparinase II/III family protein [Aquirufa ecclesiirivi]|uniref:heparinase II/III family protein n=1 Tax=Aquirufa ecclesiirivi TaxID=2715124 RepID=UPI003BB0A919
MWRKIALIFHTIKYLKPTQILGRFIHFLPRSIRSISTYPNIDNETSYQGFIVKKSSTEDLDCFTFLSETNSLSSLGWDHPQVSKLWRYNLHYFDFINSSLAEEESRAEKELELIHQWIDENAFGKGTAWEPYPSSLRIINWIKWHWRTKSLTDKALISLWNQVRYLGDRPEYHLLGNHLFINAKALIFAGVFFEGKEAKAFLDQGIQIIQEELDEQFLADGAHFELSPMYHALGLEDLLEIRVVGHSKVPDSILDKIDDKIRVGLTWLKQMSYSNGELAHFNDCANDIAPSLGQLESMASSLGLNPCKMEKNAPTGLLEASGFFVFESKEFKMIADVGEIGPSYLPGHAHADSLSFELALQGERVIVNSGTSLYGLSQERLRQRSTCAHSTVEINGENSSEVWSGFRVARRASPFDLKWNQDGTDFTLACSHTGYQRFSKDIIHRRIWTKDGSNLTIKDLVFGHIKRAKVRYFLHPEITIEEEGVYLHLDKNGKRLATVKASDGENDISIMQVKSTYHPNFGKLIATTCLEMEMTETQVLILKIAF